MVVWHIWCITICRIVCRVPRKWTKSIPGLAQIIILEFSLNRISSQCFMQTKVYFLMLRRQELWQNSNWDGKALWQHKDRENWTYVWCGRAWFVRDYATTSSVISIIEQLGWRFLEQRRSDARLSLMYKIVDLLVTIPTDQLIPPSRPTRHSHSSPFRQ